MEFWSSKKIRRTWLEFFNSKQHLIVPSKSLIPVNDPSLLWINSGVATLKDYFTGIKNPPAPRLTNSQKSLRTNDIENVGVTSRHHTLFEMLGNFAIGDYFKKEALEFAHELLFKVFKFDQSLIYITYFGEDEETLLLWKSLGIQPSHLIKGTRKTNFWDVGQGPCGPCSEIFYDRGEKFDPKRVGLDLLKNDLENDRYIEIWNIVFSQFNNDGQNHYTELKQKNIDTGAGLERITAILQGGATNFDTDLFLPIIHATEALVSVKYDPNNYFTKEPRQALINKRFRVIADHLRAAASAIQDGAHPSSTQRGYIIRRLIRRAYREGLMLGITSQTFLHTLVPVVAKVLDVYPLDIEAVSKVIKTEEEAFAKTIKQGEALLNETLKGAHGHSELDASVAFKLFETFGFPLELTEEIALEHGLKVDKAKLDVLFERHAAVSRAEKSTAMDKQLQIVQEVTSLQSKFFCYTELEVSTHVVHAGTEDGLHYVLLSETPFYATSGGQECDRGTIDNIPVTNVFKDKIGNIWHVTDAPIRHHKVTARVDKALRQAKMQNHSATHLLNLALREVFGPKVVQLGSFNNESYLRFDFPLSSRPEKAQLMQVESKVNAMIQTAAPRHVGVMTLAEARTTGALFLENETYEEPVRVVTLGASKELCGGTHVKNTSDIEKFKIIHFESKGANVYRIEALTSKARVDAYEAEELKRLEGDLKRQIAKNQALDASYHLAYHLTSHGLTEAMEAAREDFKRLNKAKQKELPTVALSKGSYHNNTVWVQLRVQDASALRALALSLREEHALDIIVLGALVKADRHIVWIASKLHDISNLVTHFKIKPVQQTGDAHLMTLVFDKEVHW